MEQNTQITAEAERIADVLDHASLSLPTGMFKDQEALDRAFALGLVEHDYRMPLAFLGLSYLSLTDAGRAALPSMKD